MVTAAFNRAGSILDTDDPLNKLFDRTRVLAQAIGFSGYKWFPTPVDAATEAQTAADSLKWLRESVSIKC